MIIDVHTHVFPEEIRNNRDKYIALDPLFKDLYANPKAKLTTADDLIGNMDNQEIDKSVILNIGWTNPELCKFTNDYIIESTARYPHRLTGFCMISLGSPESSLRELERCVQHGIKGVGEIRIAPDLFQSTIMNPVIQYLVQHRLILLTHTSEPIGHIYPGKGDITPEVLYPFITAHPDLKLVCAHWGGGLPFYALMPEVNKALQNVYFDTAASPYLYNSQIYSQVCELVGSKKILFGSDYPLLRPRRLLVQLEELNLPRDMHEDICSQNAIDLLGLN